MKKELIILQVDCGNMPSRIASEYMATVKQQIAMFKDKHPELEYAFLILPNTINAVYRGDMNNDLKIEIKEERVINEGKVDENTLTNKSFLYCDNQKIGVISDESIKKICEKHMNVRRGDEFLIEEGQLSLETARFNVNGKILSYNELKELEEKTKKDKEC